MPSGAASFFARPAIVGLAILALSLSLSLSLFLSLSLSLCLSLSLSFSLHRLCDFGYMHPSLMKMFLLFADVFMSLRQPNLRLCLHHASIHARDLETTIRRRSTCLELDRLGRCHCAFQPEMPTRCSHNCIPLKVERMESQ